MSHTPGPWKAVEWGSSPGRVAVAQVGTFVVMHWGDGPGWSGEPQDDARLIAAAPDLLDALEAYDAWADKVVCRDPELAQIREQIRAAIAKAKGEL